MLLQNFLRTEEELGQLLYTREGNLDMTCMGSSGCAISCVSPDVSVKASPGVEGAEAATEKKGGFAMEAFHLGECLSGQTLSSQCWSPASQPYGCKLVAPRLFPEEVSPGPTEGFGSQSQTERAAFRSKNFHLCPEHLREK